MRKVPHLLIVALLTTAMPALAQLVVYDDQLQNGFQNWSWGGGSNFAQTTIRHSGTAAIAFTGSNYNGISFVRQGQPLDTGQYGVLRLWVHGGSGGGQPLLLMIQSADALVASAPLAGYVDGGAIVAATWKAVTVPLTTPPLSLDGAFDRIDIQSDAAAAQPTVYIDDIVLEAVVTIVDRVFANGFDGIADPGPATNGLTVDHDVTVSGMVSDRFRWFDSAGHPRAAVLAHNDGQTGPQTGYPNRGGALREYQYQLPSGATRTAGVTTYGNAGHGGFGYVVSHAGSLANCTSGDDSPLGMAFSGDFQRVFEGRNHAIFRFTQSYPRYCTTVAPAEQRNIAVTIDWMFSTGRDHPVWSISYDLSALTANRYRDDSRAPYGELAFDGSGAQSISGVAWGDRWQFASTSAPLTLNSQWTWNTPNSVPWVKLWTAATDATMGIVQTQTLAQKDAGARNPWYHDIRPFWNTTSANGNAGDGYVMPWQDSWPYQANAYSIGVSTPNNNPRLTWGTSYGFLGQTSYDTLNGLVATASGWPRTSYSTYIVLGTHSSDPVGVQLAQIETLQTVVLAATVGSVATTGSAGVGRPDTMTYSPAGYDPVYAALTFNAAAGGIDATIGVGAGLTLNRPLLVIRNWTAGWPAELRLGGSVLVADSDYHASLRSDSNELWITLNRNVSGSGNRIVVTP